MEVIKETLKNVMQGLETQKQELSQDNPQTLLEEIFSKKELKHIQLNYLKKGILNLDVDSSTWLYHLSLKKEGLLAQIGKKTSSINDIRFRLGGIKCKRKK